MKSTSKTIEQAAYDVVRKHHLTKIHGWPNRAQLINMIDEILAKIVDIDISDTYGDKTVDDAMNNFGCLAGIMTEDEYLQRTTLDWEEPTEPDYYDINITDEMPRHVRKRMEEVHNQKITDYWTYMGTMRGLAVNIREALQEQYYSKLKHSLTAYNAVKPRELLEHVGEVWAPMDTKSKRELRKDYYQPWNVGDGVLLSAFTQALVDKRVKLQFHGITINDDELNEHFVAEMYASNKFTAEDKKAWEEKDEADKDDWDTIVEYFNNKMTATDIYLNNASGADKIQYERAANVAEDKLADIGDDLREFILTLQQSNIINSTASTTVTDTTANVKDTKDTKYDAMTERMMVMETMMKDMMKQMGAKKPAATGPASGDDKDGVKTKTFKYPRNMGGYCDSCGFHPVGPKHNSETCNRKREGHVATVTWTNRSENGCMEWPVAAKVKPSQQEHTAYKGKSAPTN
jgi:hypothetical protein